MSEKMTENAVKILTRKEKQELQFLIEEFLEKKEKQLEKGLRDHPEKAGDYLERLHKLLFRNTSGTGTRTIGAQWLRGSSWA